jgi:hypothetical protein
MRFRAGLARPFDKAVSNQMPRIDRLLTAMLSALSSDGGSAEPLAEPRENLTADEKTAIIAIWAKAVDTQMHFNEMSVKARQFGLAFVAAALGLGVVLLGRGEAETLVVRLGNGGSFKLNAAVLVAIASAVAMYAVSLLDLGVYHRMLRGSVAFGEDFEENYMKQIFRLEKGMTQAISHFSRFSDAEVRRNNGRYLYFGCARRTAEQKIRRFYRFSILSLLALAVILFIVTAEGKMPIYLRNSSASTVDSANSDTAKKPNSPALLPSARKQ